MNTIIYDRMAELDVERVENAEVNSLDELIATLALNATDAYCEF